MPRLSLPTIALLAALAAPPAPGAQPSGTPPAADRSPLAPHVRAVLSEKEVLAWDFRGPGDAWPSLHDCQVSVSDGTLRLECVGEDPYVRVPLPRSLVPLEGPLVFRAKVRTTAAGAVQMFWATGGMRGFAADHVVTVDGPPADGAWHDLRLELPARAAVTGLRLDPAMGKGLVELREARLVRVEKHPLVFESFEVTPAAVRGRLRNTAARPIAFTVNGKGYTVAGDDAVAFEAPRTPATPRAPFEKEQLTVRAEGLPPVERTVYVHNPDVPAAADAWLDLERGSVRVRVARDGTGARVYWKGRLAAIACPLAEHLGQAVPLKAVREGETVMLAGGPVEKLAVRLDGDEVLFDVKASARVTGPAVRVVGPLEQGLLAGVEHLGKGEASSSTLDLEGPASIRFEPDPLHLTLPLAAVVSDHHAAALLWDDTSLQPVFSCPNRYDGTADHLMAVKGRQARLRLRLGDGFADGARLEDSILWAMRQRGGLPDVPPVPRPAADQRTLSLAALNGSVRGPDGWRHVADGSPGHPFADHVSTLIRLTGEVPQVKRLVPGGSHVENDAAYLLTGRAKEWLAVRASQAEGLRRSQQPDGSWRYAGKYRKGHFEDTASGICARPAAVLLEHARLTGNAESRAAGLKALDYMKKFRTPRGAQTWEIPLHTPDILASAWLVAAYVRGFELTGNDEYLALSRRWALSGVPFVYLWDRYPVMRYATTPVLGATDWTSVVWIGLPVQWCGTVYAHALLELAPHDKTLDWRRLAEGILVCGEQMQYPDGPHVGTLPDSFHLARQRRQPADINPCVLVLLRDLLQGRPGGLSLARDDRHRVVAPFPVTLQNGKAVVEARPGLSYEVVVDGTRIIPVTSQGRDVIALP